MMPQIQTPSRIRAGRRSMPELSLTQPNDSSKPVASGKERWQQIQQFAPRETPFREAMGLLREMATGLRERGDEQGCEQLRQAIKLLSSRRMSLGASSHAMSVAAHLQLAPKGEALGMRQWVPDERGTPVAHQETYEGISPACRRDSLDSKLGDESDRENSPCSPPDEGMGHGIRSGGRRRSLRAASNDVSMEQSSQQKALDKQRSPTLSEEQRVLHATLRAGCVSGADGEMRRLLEHGVNEWEFDVFKLHGLSGGHALLALGWFLFERHGLNDYLGVTPEVTLDFLSRVESNYNAVSYHNSMHAGCVTHALHWLIMSSDTLADIAASPIELLASLLSALVHDLGHNGYNNAFHNASNSELAVRYSYQSPLERHHLALAFQIMSDAQIDLLGGLSLTERKEFREQMVGMVLATDFSLHKAIIDEFEEMITLRGASAENSPPAESSPEPLPISRPPSGRRQLLLSQPFSAEDKLLALKIAIKTADLGNLSKGHTYNMQWTGRVLEEFFGQGDAEKALGLPVSPGFERQGHSLAVSQLGFIKFMVQPLYDMMELLTPLDLPQSNLRAMRDYYQLATDRESELATKPPAKSQAAA